VNVLAEDHGPSLSGRQGADRMRRPRAPWWVHFCAASFLGYFALVMFSYWYPPASVGISFGTPMGGLIVGSVTANSEADHAGVQPGDRLVAVNGRRFRNARDQRAFTASARVGEERTWLFERSGRQFSFTFAPHRHVLVLDLRVLPIHVGLLASLVFSFVVIYSRH
jgi:membrane-associated protease RseP (regulator of RpoE activity)